MPVLFRMFCRYGRNKKAGMLDHTHLDVICKLHGAFDQSFPK